MSEVVKVEPGFSDFKAKKFENLQVKTFQNIIVKPVLILDILIKNILLNYVWKKYLLLHL